MNRQNLQEAKRHLKQAKLYMQSDEIGDEAIMARIRMALDELQ